MAKSHKITIVCTGLGNEVQELQLPYLVGSYDDWRAAARAVCDMLDASNIRFRAWDENDVEFRKSKNWRPLNTATF